MMWYFIKCSIVTDQRIQKIERKKNSENDYDGGGGGDDVDDDDVDYDDYDYDYDGDGDVNGKCRCEQCSRLSGAARQSLFFFLKILHHKINIKLSAKPRE